MKVSEGFKLGLGIGFGLAASSMLVSLAMSLLARLLF
jgi:hypothetical protein